MHVLLSNDDGILAPGLLALAKAVREAGHRVTIYAPNVQRSGAARSMAIYEPLEVLPVDLDGFEAWSVSGTPVDCVRVALYRMRGHWPDFLLTGINQGQNRGSATGYSGTVGAAMEGSISGVPSMAVSLCSFTSQDFSEAARLAAELMEWAVRHPLPNGEIYSLNVPVGEIRGVRAATLSNEFTYKLAFDVIDETHLMPTWDDRELPETDPNSDLNVNNAGYASVSVLTQSPLSAISVPELSDYPNGIAHTGLEIERKYLIRMPDEGMLRRQPDCEVWEITQTYLHDGENHETRRVRRIETSRGIKYIYTNKRHVSDLTHIEKERELTRGEYDLLCRDVNPKLSPIHKRRYRIPYAGHTLEIDIYDFWKDRATLEAEMASEDEAVRLPPWLDIVREVTGESAYKNRKLAKKVPYEEI